MICSALSWTVLVLASPIAIYLAARMIFAAYFLTREQFNKRRSRHG